MSDTRITVRVTPDLVEQLAELRERFGATNSQVIRRALRALAESEDQVAPVTVADPDEIARLLTEKARNGHVGAMGTLLRHHEQAAKAKPDDKPANAFADIADPTPPAQSAEVKDLSKHRASRAS